MSGRLGTASSVTASVPGEREAVAVLAVGGIEVREEQPLLYKTNAAESAPGLNGLN